MSETTANAVEANRASSHRSAIEVRVPASTSNLGAGFDCFGLALQLYLTVRATRAPENAEACRARTVGAAGSASLSRTTDNLIYRAMRFVAEREGFGLPPLRLAVKNEIPLGGGLGSSAAAIVAGLTLGAALGGVDLSNEFLLRYAVALEGHADNVAASALGGFVVTCTARDGRVIAVKRRWPRELKIIVVSPHAQVATTQARAVLAAQVAHADAVHNLQRVALFDAALAEQRYELLWEAMQDRLHQERRQSLLPGLMEALATPRQAGLLGLALSGAGPSIVALAQDRFENIGEAIASSFRQHGIEATARVLDVDDEGLRLSA